jgi:hypothetical protein
MPIAKLLERTKATLTARNQADLMQMVRELTDHKLVVIHHDAKKNPIICITLPPQTLRKFAEIVE